MLPALRQTLSYIVEEKSIYWLRKVLSYLLPGYSGSWLVHAIPS
jgi:hypothetical protein